MDVLFHVSHPDAARIATPLARALTSLGGRWACFLTNDGVTILDDPSFREVLTGAERVVVCEHSWDTHMTGRACPAERGSQTINSALMSEAARVISL